MLQLGPIAQERRLKLESMLADRIKEECRRFALELERGLPGISPEGKASVEEALKFNLSQNYGPNPRDRFYCVHPIRVARFLAASLGPGAENAVDALLAALLHNAIEKKILQADELERRYGRWVANAISTLTPDRAKTATKEGLRAYYGRIRESDREVRQLKVFDKFDNIFALCLNPDADVRRSYLEEIRTEVRPLVELDMPWLLSYFDELVLDAERTGHFNPRI